MSRQHLMVIGADNGDSVLIACPECGRRVVLKRCGEMVVLDRGDIVAGHSVNRGPVAVGVDLA